MKMMIPKKAKASQDEVVSTRARSEGLNQWF